MYTFTVDLFLTILGAVRAALPALCFPLRAPQTSLQIILVKLVLEHLHGDLLGYGARVLGGGEGGGGGELLVVVGKGGGGGELLVVVGEGGGGGKLLDVGSEGGGGGLLVNFVFDASFTSLHFTECITKQEEMQDSEIRLSAR
jgi:hypothetical protein